MNELFERADFIEVIEHAENALRVNLEDNTIDEYFTNLLDKELPDIRKALKSLIRSGDFQRTFPQIFEIRREIRRLRRADYSGKGSAIPYFCAKCNETGFRLIRTVRNEIEGTYAYRCDCVNGDMKSKLIPPYSKIAQELGLDRVPEEKLKEFTWEELKGGPPEFFKGAIRKKCSRCSSTYVLDYPKEIPFRTLLAYHDASDHFCDACRIDIGRKKGLWR